MPKVGDWTLIGIRLAVGIIAHRSGILAGSIHLSGIMHPIVRMDGVDLAVDLVEFCAVHIPLAVRTLDVRVAHAITRLVLTGCVSTLFARPPASRIRLRIKLICR